MEYLTKLELQDVKPEVKERRSRQPNWTESEKQLLLALTKNYHEILENKSSDAQTMRKKSHVWDMILLHMNKAGYNRSKERLKQQLGRMRAASVKRDRELMAKHAVVPSTADNNHTTHASYTTDNCSKANYLRYSSGYTLYNGVQNFKQQQNNYNIKIEQVKASYKSVDNGIDTKPTIVQPVIVLSDDDDNDAENDPAAVKNRGGKRALPNARDDHRTTYRRLSQLQKQLHYYRIAVERERLQTLRMQQKHERLIYIKDQQIQKLMLKLLRTLTQHSDANPMDLY